MRNWILLMIIASVSLISCETEQTSIAGIWTVDTMTISGENMTAADLYHPVYNFYEDGTYDISMESYVERGEWKVEDDIFTLTKADGEDAVLTIVEVTDTHFTYETGEGDYKTTVVLEKN